VCFAARYVEQKGLALAVTDSATCKALSVVLGFVSNVPWDICEQNAYLPCDSSRMRRKDDGGGQKDMCVILLC
jgi:hypothetical protein